MKAKTPLSRLIHSFRHAGRGIGAIICSEANFRIHLVGALVAIGLGWWLTLAPWEWCVLLLCIGFVLCAEALNTSLEYLANALHPEHHPGVGKAKDAAAGGVLLAALAAGATGAIILLPKLWVWIQSLSNQ